EQVLRRELGFKRVLITDDLDMKAVSEQFKDGNMIAHALNVGCDMFIVARQPGADDMRTIFLAERIAAAIQDKSVAEDTLFRAFSRINSVFEDMLPDNEPHELSKETFAAHQALAREIESSITAG